MDHLQEAVVPIWDDTECQLRPLHLAMGPRFDPRTQVCAETREKHADGGDSGGPLVSRLGGSDVLIGIVSAGWGDPRDFCIPCPTGDIGGEELEPVTYYPGIYVRVSAYNEWINGVISAA